MKAVIIAHGDSIEPHILEREVKNADIVICADGGAEYAFKNNVLPDYLIGDFDSINKDVYDYYEKKKIEIIKYPVEKDYTDTEICVNKAIELKCTDICIIAGIGSRIDHSLGNIGLLHKCSSKGIRGYIATEKAYVYHCTDERHINGEIGDTISIIPYKGDAIGLFTNGLKYPLHDSCIKFGSPLGISNIMTHESCSIRIKSGEILIIKQIID